MELKHLKFNIELQWGKGDFVYIFSSLMIETFSAWLKLIVLLFKKTNQYKNIKQWIKEVGL